ncbi:hypothetical protein [Ancylobacter amanitiformis]|uniref:Tetratricopeptide (TPR) repeat protein n=1 Tax=Ancylobacter amanitiformis TaxID=217069 RepID=A0ABU0LWL3_9HYPH|nr:hypothetical protein [Ancylobacter amanitiformis]MDQ0513116.1 tetratricopeptide (TPR) repeat protein [Ancylobacter amanitiformis]
MSLKRAALLIVLGGAVLPAIAQQVELPGGSGSRSASDNGGSRQKVDETALRYFASQGDTRRLDAEIARLRALYPEWSPPADLFGPQTDIELERLWKLYAEGKYSDVRGAIATRQAADSSWDPPADLIARLNEAETRQRLVNASDAQQWSTVLRLATETPGVLTCTNVDILWRVAEAFAKTNQIPRALDAYTYVLTNCNDAGERLATMQKAIPLLSDDQIANLMKFERKDAEGKPEFALLRDDLIRRRMGRAAENPEYSVPDADIKRMEELARQGSSAGDPLLLGWYLFRHDDARRALEWFKLALDRKGGSKAAEGYVLALNALGRALEAEPIAYEWRDSAPENNKAYLDVVISLLTADPAPVLDALVLTRFSPVVIRDKYVPGAQALGWYAYNTGQIVTAQSWFETALNWDPNDEPSAYGLSLAYWRLGDRARLAAMVQSWGSRSERILALVDPNVRARLEARNGQAPVRTTNPLIAAAARLTPTPTLQPPPLGVPTTSAVRGVGGAGAGFQPIPTAGALAYTPASAPATGFAPIPTAAMQATPQSVSPQAAMPQAVTPQVAADRAYAAAPAARYEAAPAPRRSAARSTPRAAGAVAESPRGGSAAAALARGWKLMDLNRPIEAVTAFDYAIQYGTGRTAEDAAYGKSLAYMRKGMTNAASVAALEAPQSPRRALQLNADLLTQRAFEFYKDGRYVEALVALDERARLGPEQQDLMLMRAWCYYHIRDFQSANRIFKALAAQGNKEATNGVMTILGATRQMRDNY